MTDLTFAVTWQRKSEPIGKRFVELARWLGSELGCKVTPKVALSYEEMLSVMRRKSADIAWLPPLLRFVLEREGVTKTLLVNERSKGTYRSVLVCREDSKIETLENLWLTRAAWVDPWSAAGYVMPRLFLSERGMRRVFESERFMGSHDGAVRRVLDGFADVAATYVNEQDGAYTTSGWSSIEDAKVRVIAEVGVIPSDVIAARAELGDAAAIGAALVRGVGDPASRAIITAALDVGAFRAPSEGDDAELARSLDRAKEQDLFPHLWERA